jgi:hypothetical protein
MDNIIKVRVPEYTKLCGAASECEAILRALGYGYVKVYGTRGSHTAEVYISKEDRERFRKELLYKTVQGISSRKFFFGKCIHPTLGEIPDEFVVSYIR